MKALTTSLTFILILGIFTFRSFALFEDQAGEFDWNIDNVGFIQNAVTKVCFNCRLYLLCGLLSTTPPYLNSLPKF
jgi:hypothetical protein